MSKIKKVEVIVKNILEENEKTRDDDFLLITCVYNKIADIESETFNKVMLSHKELGLPSIETITRSRRKLQEKYEYLKSKKEIEKLRKKQEIEFINYAKEKEYE